MTAREVQKRNRTVLRTTMILWMIASIIYGWLNIQNVVNNPELQDTQDILIWALLNFFLFKVPWLALILMVILILELLILKNPWKLVTPKQ